MSYQFSFRHMEVSEALRDFAEQRLEKSFSYMTEAPHTVHMVFEEVVGSISVRCDVTSSQGDFHVSHKCDNAYESVEKALSKLDSQIRKAKPERRRGKVEKGERWEFLKEDSEADEADENYETA